MCVCVSIQTLTPVGVKADIFKAAPSHAQRARNEHDQNEKAHRQQLHVPVCAHVCVRLYVCVCAFVCVCSSLCVYVVACVCM